MGDPHREQKMLLDWEHNLFLMHSLLHGQKMFHEREQKMFQTREQKMFQEQKMFHERCTALRHIHLDTIFVICARMHI